MECPHCAQETDPTLVYCKVCGEQIELDPEAVHKALERDAELDAIEIMEEQSRGALYVALFLLVATFALRLVLIRDLRYELSVGYRAPSKIVEDKAVDPNPYLDVDPYTIDIPEEGKREQYLQQWKEITKNGGR